MKIAVIFPNACSNSGRKLAQALAAKPYNMSDVYGKSFREYDLVFNYGWGGEVLCKNIINNWTSVNCCINKIKTLSVLKAAGVPCINYTVKASGAKDWEWTVVRTSIKGNNSDGMEYVQKGVKLPDAPLYTEWYEHNREYRIVVFRGSVVARYWKQRDETDGSWWFVEPANRGFKQMDAACIAGAKALGIDYVGFDVLAVDKKDFRICEANSGPIITDRVVDAIVKELKHEASNRKGN